MVIINAKEYSLNEGEETVFSHIQVYTNDEEINNILQDKPELVEYNNNLLKEGYILENIVVKTYSGNSTTYALNSDTSDEIVIMDHRQPARSKKVFAEDIYNTIAYINNPVMLTLGFISYVWVPFTLFGITTEMVGTSLSDEWYQISDNNTLHTKVAYIYDEERDNKYWGAEASCLHVSATVIEVVYDDNNDAYQSSESFNMDLKSPNYDNDAELLRLGRLYYKEIVTYSETYDDICYLE